MEKWLKVLIGIGITLITLLIIHGIAYAIVPPYRKMINEITFIQRDIDEETSYVNRKKVEDTARAMITNYEAYKLTYLTYKDSENKTERDYAVSAKIAANNIASNYNNYLTQNSFVFKENLPKDIPLRLLFIE